MNHRLLASIAYGRPSFSPWSGRRRPRSRLKLQRPPRNRLTPAKRWTLSRTPDGQPDLQGFWTNTTYVSLERPKDVAKSLLHQREWPRGSRRPRRLKPNRPSLEPSPTCTTTSPNSGWTVSSRTSRLESRIRRCIVDPPDGRIPPLTAEDNGGQLNARARRGGPAARTTRRRINRSAFAASSWTASAPDAGRGLQQQLSDRASSRLRDDSDRDDPRRPNHSSGRTSASAATGPSMDR